MTLYVILLNIFGKLTNIMIVSQLLLMSLNKTVKEKDQLRESNSQLRCYINGLRASECALKEMIMDAEESQDLKLVSWRPRMANGVVPVRV